MSLKSASLPNRLGHSATAGLRQNGFKSGWVKVLLITKTFPPKQIKSVEKHNAYLAEKGERQRRLLSIKLLSLRSFNEADQQINMS